MKLGKLTKIKDLRRIWKNEATDFTPWLAKEENLQILSDEIGIDIDLISTEAKTGSFSTDILAYETNTTNKIVIENQLESTDHDHLGKIITYASGHEAKTIIWIVKDVREEHRQAIDWLNEHTDEEINVFLCKIELWQINHSEIAPKFQVICRPNNWTKTIKNINNSEVSDTKLLQYNYWAKVQEYIDNNSDILKSRNPQQQNWYDLALGTSQAHIMLSINSIKKYVTCNIYINDNKSLYDCLYAQKDDIERELGLKMEWNKMDNKKASTIEIIKEIDPMDENNWEESIQWQVLTAEKLYYGFADKIKLFIS